MLTLGEETWGEKVRRAYYRSKTEFGHTWAELATRISRVQSTTHTTLMEFAKFETKPTRVKKLQEAWLLAVALGIDPAEFDLNLEDTKFPPQAAKTYADLLRPPSSCMAVTAA